MGNQTRDFPAYNALFPSTALPPTAIVTSGFVYSNLVLEDGIE
jgi:hypothetical protein